MIFGIFFELRLGVLLLQTHVTVYTLSTRRKAGCEVRKMQHIYTVNAYSDPLPAGATLIIKH